MSAEKGGCLHLLGEALGMILVAFLGFWVLWFLNALVLEVYSTFSEDQPGKLLAAVASIGEILILSSLDGLITSVVRVAQLTHP
ncbi:MAG: hypothetical protein ABSH56_15935 [Bryobacteraceae bacterium]|jgi:hypothetical protein